VTYHALIGQMRGKEPVLIPAVRALRDTLDEIATRVESTHARVEDLAAAQIAPGTMLEVMAYLRARTADWDTSVWHGDEVPQSAIERRLRMRLMGRDPSLLDREMNAAEASAGQRLLVVVGGPGSGKTWLARRYAREASQAALSKLEGGAGLDEVELPLFTTWDQWRKTPGGTRESLVAASFASGLGQGDLGGEATRRLQRTFTERRENVLLVLDALDEAADLEGQSGRLRELTSMVGWRVVVTSRHAAWDATFRGDRNRADGLRVVELQDLEYPSDVNACIGAWFAADPSRGDALIEQIRTHDDLRRGAVVPLMLTFYCLLAEESDTVRPLPARRRELYRRLVPRLLLGRWSTSAPGPDAAPDLNYDWALLSEWAWHAVRDRTTPTGLGDWGDSFVQPTTPKRDERRSIDNVAPKVTENDEGEITRRFVHRTFLEHFVAEHIATLDTEEAARFLLPHLWFDPDWLVACPAAIAAHNELVPGALLQRLLDQAVHPVRDKATGLANAELIGLLFAIAAESEPSEWPPEQQNLIHRCREGNAPYSPQEVTKSAHWSGSNQGARAALLNALLVSVGEDLGNMVTALLELGATDDERAEARTALLARTGDPEVLDGLAKVLVELGATDEEQVLARTAMLALLTADPMKHYYVATGLVELGATDEERAEARTALLSLLATAAPMSVSRLLKALSALRPTDDERAEARTVWLNHMSTAGPFVVGSISRTFPVVAINDAERAEVRAALLNALPAKNLSPVPGLLYVLPEVLDSDADRGEIRASLLNALPTTPPKDVYDLVWALLHLCPSDPERLRPAPLCLTPCPTPPRRTSVV
jgi:hypothetical protein